MHTVLPYQGLKYFVDWLKEQKEKHQAKKVILLAHGDLDAPCLLNNLEQYNLAKPFMEIVSGFGDTLPIIQNKLAAAFERLYHGETFDAHNAFADAEALFKILLKKQESQSKQIELTNHILKNTVKIEDMLEFTKFKVSRCCLK